MKHLMQEVRAMQNPGLGAILIWRFACGYTPGTSSIGTPLPLVFAVIPLVMHVRSVEQITSTNASSGLRKFQEKFERRGDLLLAVHQRMLQMRPLSLRSVRIALGSGLVTLVPQEAVLWPRSYTSPPDPSGVDHLLAAAEKLGKWCNSLTLFEIEGILRVEF
jgi:hypothetical protein